MASDPRIEELLEELLDSDHTPEDVCRTCPELLPQVRARWQRLRAFDNQLEAMFPALASSTGVGLTRVEEHTDLPPIPGYEVEAVLGRGGMGIVYKARHLRLNRPVALKMLLAGVHASPEHRERFLREAEAAAGLRHPHIVQVHDVGEHHGQPYFTMEFVEGGTLAQKLAGTPQPVLQAAAMLVALAEAVHVAHRGGIVHRDLKPANVLHTAEGTLKISDFGLARRFEGGPGLTQSGAWVGTPSYMAPEQARGKAGAAEPAVDIYALGAILYELLTGRPPFRAETGAETIQQMLSQDPVPPTRLNVRVPRDLETICLKCLHKAPERRYASATALAEDLGRFQRGEPIAARPIGWPQRLRRWARRRPAVAALSGALLAALLLLVVSLVAGMLLTADALEQTQQAEQAAHAQRAAAEKAAAAERAAKEVAQKRLAQIEKAQEILVSVFHDLNPRLEQKGGSPLLEQLGQRLDRAADLLEGEAVGEPLLVARLQLELGQVQLDLGYPKRAIALFSKAHRVLTAELGADHRETLQCASGLARAYHGDGRNAEALVLVEQTLAKCKVLRGADHPDTLLYMCDLAGIYLASGQHGKAVLLYEQALAKQKATIGADHGHTVITMSNLAVAYAASGQAGRAVPLFEQALAKQTAQLGADHVDTLATMSFLAAAYQDNGQMGKALALFELTLQKQKAKLGAGHADTVTTMSNLAIAYQADGQTAKVLPLYESALETRKAKLGSNHPATLTIMLKLAGAYRDAGKAQLALPLSEELLTRCQTQLGTDNVVTLAAMNNLAANYTAVGQAGKAVPLYEQLLEKWQGKPGADHLNRLKDANELALAYMALGHRAKAMVLLEQTLQKLRGRLGADEASLLLGVMTNLAIAYHADGQTSKALALFEEALEKTQAQLGPDHLDSLKRMSNLAEAYRAAGQMTKAVPLWEEVLPKLKDLLGPDHPDTVRSMSSLAMAYYASGQPAKALPLWEETFQKRKSQFGADHPATLETVNNLSAAYFQQKRYGDAEAMLTLWLAQQRPKLGAEDPNVAVRLSLLGQCQLLQKDYTAAEKSLQDSLAIYKKTPAMLLPIYDTQSLLGAALAGQEKYADAEPLLLGSARFLQANVAKIPAAHQKLVRAAVQRVIDLYEDWERPEDAARWRLELDGLKK